MSIFSKNHLRIFFITLVLIGRSAHAAPQRVCTVFVHGTTQATLFIVNPFHFFNDSFTGDTAAELILNDIRADGVLERCDLMLSPGLIEVTNIVNQEKIPDAYHYKAAIHTIRCFKRVADENDEPGTERHYYTFGWSGLLSAKERDNAAAHLYAALVGIREKYAGEDIQFEIHAHSHGAQIIFQLPFIAQSNPLMPPLIIDTVILSAPPLYAPKVLSAYSGMFKTIVNIYSKGDTVQTYDFVSTPRNACKKTFSQLDLSSIVFFKENFPLVIDVHLCAQGDSQVFGHASFFMLDRYSPQAAKSNQRQINSIVSRITPLPLVCLYPAIIPQIVRVIQSHTPALYHACDININMSGEYMCAIQAYMQDATTKNETMIMVPLPACLAHAQQETHSIFKSKKYLSNFEKTMLTIKGIWKFIRKPTQKRIIHYDN